MHLHSLPKDASATIKSSELGFTIGEYNKLLSFKFFLESTLLCEIVINMVVGGEVTTLKGLEEISGIIITEMLINNQLFVLNYRRCLPVSLLHLAIKLITMVYKYACFKLEVETKGIKFTETFDIEVQLDEFSFKCVNAVIDSISISVCTNCCILEIRANNLLGNHSNEKSTPRWFNVTIITSANTQDEILPQWSGFLQKDEGETQ
ncbi:hypothetical protein YC2023_113868 [Brassica napus]